MTRLCIPLDAWKQNAHHEIGHFHFQANGEDPEPRKHTSEASIHFKPFFDSN